MINKEMGGLARDEKDSIIKNNLKLIQECLNNDNLSFISKYVVIRSIMNPELITEEVLKWAESIITERE